NPAQRLPTKNPRGRPGQATACGPFSWRHVGRRTDGPGLTLRWPRLRSPTGCGPAQTSGGWSRRCEKDAAYARALPGGGDTCCAPSPIAARPRAVPPPAAGRAGGLRCSLDTRQLAEYLLSFLTLLAGVAHTPSDSERVALHQIMHDMKEIGHTQ